MDKCPKCGEYSLQYIDWQKRAVCSSCGFNSPKLKNHLEYVKKFAKVVKPTTRELK